MDKETKKQSLDTKQKEFIEKIIVMATKYDEIYEKLQEKTRTNPILRIFIF